DDHLAAALGRYAVPLAVRVKFARPCDTQARLQGAGSVVDARVDDAAVVPALVGTDPWLLLDDREAQAAPAVEDVAGGGQAADAGADHAQVVEAHRSMRRPSSCQTRVHIVNAEGRGRACHRFKLGIRNPAAIQILVWGLVTPGSRTG